MALNWRSAVRRFWIWPITFGIPFVAVAIWAIASAQRNDSADGQGEVPDDLVAGFVPTPQPVVEKMLEVAEVKKEDVVYDLGCGDGRIVVTAAKIYGCKAVGIDIDPRCIQDSNENRKKNKVEELVTIEKKDFFQVDLGEATVVALYLLPEVNIKLIPKLQELKPGTRIVCHNFGIKGMKAEKIVPTEMTHPSGIHTAHKIYLYVAPLEKER